MSVGLNNIDELDNRGLMFVTAGTKNSHFGRSFRHKDFPCSWHHIPMKNNVNLNRQAANTLIMQQPFNHNIWSRNMYHTLLFSIRL